jgi:flagellar hook-associated protein 3 FlgL
MYNFLNSLNKSLERQNEIQEQLSDGRVIHRPSDDPVKVIRSLKFHTDLDMNEQFTQNVKDARSWMETTDGALKGMDDIIIKVKELTIQAIAPNPTESKEAIASEIDGLINQAVDLANTKMGNRYIFAGQKDDQQPFTRSTTLPDQVIYSGDNNIISMPIKQGLADPTKDGVNLTGGEVFGPVANDGTAKVFSDLIKLKNDILNDTSDHAAVQADLDTLDKNHSYILTAQTKLGTRSANYEMAENMLDANNITITGNVAANEDLDLARAIIDFKNSENVYRTALSVGARIMPPSLVDFLR